MARMLILALVLLLGSGVALASDAGNCVTCHQDWEDEDGPSHKSMRDIHFQRGLECEDCHGGDPTLDDMDDVRDSRGYLGVPDYLSVPDFCARCHSDAAYMHEHNPALPVDQLAKYKTSIHGQKLFGSKDKKVANCVSCHSVHEIADEQLPYSSVHPLNLPGTCGKCHADAEYMADYGIPTDQLEGYVGSVHGRALLERKDLGAPACNDCHGNHGAAPPGIASIASVCGVCHAMEADLFAASPHAQAFEENEFPMCETCHSNHAIAEPSDIMIGDGDAGVCGDCHSDGDGTAGMATADSTLAAIENLAAARAGAAEALSEAQEKGMMTTDEEFRLKEVDQVLIQTRTLIHAFSIDSVKGKAATGLAAADSIAVSSAALVDEYYFRRKGLLLTSLFMTLLAVLLWRRIRQIDKEAP